MTKSINLFKNISIFLCLVPMLLLSFFCLVPDNQPLKVSAADSSITPYTFYGSNLDLCASSIDTNDNDHDVTTLINVNISFGFADNDFSWHIYGTLLRPGYNEIRTFNSSSSINTNIITPGSIASSGTFWFYLPTLENTRFAFLCLVKFKNRNTIPSSDIVKVTLGHNTSVPGFSKYISNRITYFDINDNYVSFEFVRYAPNYGSSSDIYSAFDLDERTYYLTLSNLGDGSIYDNGYTNGYNDGLSAGQDLGYNDGYNAGINVGYGNGYNDGLEVGGDYTFLGLIGAVIDAPVSAFTGLLNFELLGVNILGFISGLLTLALIIFIIKLCIGGK